MCSGLLIFCPKMFNLNGLKELLMWSTQIFKCKNRLVWFHVIVLHGCCKLSHDYSCLTKDDVCQSSFYGRIIQVPYLEYIILTHLI